MSEIRMPEDLERLPVFMVLDDSPAWNALCRMCQNGPVKPGQIIAVSQEEIDSLRNDVVAVTIKEHLRG